MKSIEVNHFSVDVVNAPQRSWPKKVAGFSPTCLSAVLKVINNAKMSEYILAAIFIWPLLATDNIHKNFRSYPPLT